MTKIEEYKLLLQSRLNDKRYHHSLCVANEAVRLAEKYGANKEKAYIAGLLHDITKNAPAEEHLHIFDSFGIMLNGIEQNAEKLWHAISGAAFVEHLLGITDQEIIDAIRYHTTARGNMTLLDKILYLADFTSEAVITMMWIQCEILLKNRCKKHFCMRFLILLRICYQTAKRFI